MITLFFAFSLFGHAKTPFETIYPSAGINQFLTACEKWVAFGTNFHFNIFLCGTRLYYFTTGTGDGRWLIFGMNTLFHFQSPLSILRDFT